MPGSPVPVSDLLSNLNDQLVTAARILGRSKHRQAIFEYIYYGPKQVKTIQEIMNKTGLTQGHVLTEGGKMAGLLVEKLPGGYKKKRDFATRYKQILSMARDKKKLERVPTKTSSKIAVKGPKLSVAFPSVARNARLITVDDIDSFSKIGTLARKDVKALREKVVKKAFTRIIGEQGSFKDWGGERSDLYTTKVRFGGKRIAAAIAFKGRATTGNQCRRKWVPMGTRLIASLMSRPNSSSWFMAGRLIRQYFLRCELSQLGRQLGGRESTMA